MNSVLIGKPISNARIYILDKYNQVQPIGVPGELYISGDGLGRGYLNNSQLTADKFVENPFEEGKMYKSGDLARWLDNGEIECLGRIDNQVKIRGFRIELGEIENKLLQYESIKASVVLAKEDENKQKTLVAYVVSEAPVSKSNLKEYLANALPEYMVPTYIIEIDKLPLTVNGKIDKRALPEPEFDANLSQYGSSKECSRRNISRYLE